MAEYNGRNKCSGWCNSGADCRKGCSCNSTGYTGMGMCQKVNNNRGINSISYRSFEGDNYSNQTGGIGGTGFSKGIGQALRFGIAIVGVGSYLAYKKYGGKGVLYLLGGLVAWYQIDATLQGRNINKGNNEVPSLIDNELNPVRGARQVNNV